jgi:Tat protein translocase TatB subunit
MVLGTFLNVSGTEIFVILVAALVILGPERLPGAMRRAGQVAGQLRDLSDNFRREVQDALADVDAPAPKPWSAPPLADATAPAAPPGAGQAAAAGERDPDPSHPSDPSLAEGGSREDGAGPAAEGGSREDGPPGAGGEAARDASAG